MCNIAFFMHAVKKIFRVLRPRNPPKLKNEMCIVLPSVKLSLIKYWEFCCRCKDDEFRCFDASCIPASKKCDGHQVKIFGFNFLLLDLKVLMQFNRLIALCVVCTLQILLWWCICHALSCIKNMLRFFTSSFSKIYYSLNRAFKYSSY